MTNPGLTVRESSLDDELIAAAQADHDTPLAILKQIVEVHTYFNAPHMHVLTFEMKFDALKLKADKLIKERGL